MRSHLRAETRPKLWAVVLATLFVITTACGGSGGGGEAEGATTMTEARTGASDPSGAATTTTSEGAEADAPTNDAPPTATPPGGAGSGGGSNDGSGNTGAAGSAGDEGPEEPPPIDVEAEFSDDCVRPGGTQTITIRTEPNTGVAYHAVYSDGSNGFDEDYPGGNNTGETDSKGVWEDTWTVGPTATEGEATVDVVALGAEGQGYTQVTFAVADLTGNCD